MNGAYKATTGMAAGVADPEHSGGKVLMPILLELLGSIWPAHQHTCAQFFRLLESLMACDTILQDAGFAAPSGAVSATQRLFDSLVQQLESHRTSETHDADGEDLVMVGLMKVLRAFLETYPALKAHASSLVRDVSGNFLFFVSMRMSRRISVCVSIHRPVVPVLRPLHVCAHVYTHVCTDVCMHPSSDLHISIRMSTHMSTRMSTHRCAMSLTTSCSSCRLRMSGTPRACRSVRRSRRGRPHLHC